jgi:hypothetical protein
MALARCRSQPERAAAGQQRPQNDVGPVKYHAGRLFDRIRQRFGG